MPIIFVIAKDWMLRAGVRAELRERGIDALGMETLDHAARAFAGGQVPAAVVVEGIADQEGPGLENLARRVPVIVVASRMEPLALPPVAAIVHRPARVQDIVEQVLRVLQGTPA